MLDSKILRKISLIKEIVSRELDNHCNDKLVFGGLETFFRNLYSSIPQNLEGDDLRDLRYKIANLLEYSKLSKRERERRLQDLHKTIDNMLSELRTAQPETQDSDTSYDDLNLSPSEKLYLEHVRAKLRSLKNAPNLPLDAHITSLRGVGPKIASKLRKLGLYTIEDLIFFFPRKYSDRRTPKNFLEAVGDSAYLKLKVISEPEEREKGKLRILRFLVRDESNTYGWLIFFNQPFLKRTIRKGVSIKVFGKVERFRGEFQIIPEEWELSGERCLKNSKFGKILPIYPLTEGISQNLMRRLIREALRLAIINLRDPLPMKLREELGLLELREAILLMHYPFSPKLLELARYRLAFQEVLIPQLVLKLSAQSQSTMSIVIDRAQANTYLEEFIRTLPFNLTGAQNRVIGEMLDDLSSGKPMRRLLQGDVGSGKTVVAATIAHILLRAGYQVAIMAPTEVLANQHYRRLQEIMKPLGDEVMLLTGRLKRRERKTVIERIQTGKPVLVIGTHALISEDIEFPNLGLVIIDEQHKFGVNQRSKLYSKGRVSPHLLVMTATPIPRTLTMTLYSELDLSVIDELPPGRGTVRTRVVPFRRLSEVYDFVKSLLRKGERAFIVCPAIEESEFHDVRTLETEYQRLLEIFREFGVAQLHGRMRSEEKEEVMLKFQRGEVSVLVSTTVIEVGIDVPEATVMVVLNADRFGLAQLHQLRGRVGRGSRESYAIFVASPRNPKALERLKALELFNDGFSIAQKDLELRGPGELIGDRQHGFWEFKVLDPLRDLDIIQQANQVASNLSRELLNSPQRYEELWQVLRDYILKKGVEFDNIISP